MAKTAFRFILILLAAGFAPSPARAEEDKIPPAINIPEALLEGELFTVYQKQIRDRVQWWKKRILFATDNDDLQKARDGFLGDYAYSDKPTYTSAFSRIAVEELTDPLKGKDIQADDKLRTQKIINVALLLSKLRSPSIQPALEYMVANNNEAVRYIGWRGYFNVRGLLLAAPKALDALAASLGRALQQEKTPILLNELFNVTNLRILPTELKPEVRRAADVKFLNAIAPTWPQRCKQVESAQETGSGMVAAVHLGANALGNIAVDLKPQGEPDKPSPEEQSYRQALRMLLSLAGSTAQTYDRVRKTKNEKSKLLAECVDMLATCEQALNEATGKKETFLNNALTAPAETVGDRGAAVQMAVLSWSDAIKAIAPEEPKAPAPK
jgi:hypothetical protein